MTIEKPLPRRVGNNAERSKRKDADRMAIFDYIKATPSARREFYSGVLVVELESQFPHLKLAKIRTLLEDLMDEGLVIATRSGLRKRYCAALN
jgi:hypothetical protein